VLAGLACGVAERLARAAAAGRVGAVRAVSPAQVDLIARIIRAVAAANGVTHIDIRSNRRDAKTVLARHTGIWLARRLTECSYPEIGWAFGKRDHTSAMYAVSRIDAAMADDPAFAGRVRALARSLDDGDGCERADVRRAG
jgi:chromosomal replication initiation ATPase DnaA